MGVLMLAQRAALMMLLMLASCAAPPSVTSSAAATQDRPSWQIMHHIKMAAFSAHDAREYDLMVFCDSDNHVRLYHLVPPDEMSAELTLRSGEARAAIAGDRELVRATPPPVSSGEGALLGARISARLDRSSHVWRAFEQTGTLDVQSGDHVTDAGATPSERAALASLFSECT